MQMREWVFFFHLQKTLKAIECIQFGTHVIVFQTELVHIGLVCNLKAVVY